MTKTVTEKLEKMNVSKNRIEDDLKTFEEQLDKRRGQIQSMKQAQVQLEAEANSLVGSISALRRLLQDDEETTNE